MALDDMWGIPRYSIKGVVEGNRPDVAAPIPLVVVQGVYVVWLVFTLLYGVDSMFQRATGLAGPTIWEQVAIAILGGLVPIIAIYGVATNRYWTKWLIPVSHVLALGVLPYVFKYQSQLFWAYVILGAAFLIILYVVFIDSSVRQYYLEISASD